MIRTCPTCEAQHRRSQAYCEDCHAAYMRRWRQGRTQDPDQRMKANARAYANVYLSRGKLQRQPCEDCGVEHADQPVRMHHEDYSKPLEVTWLCDWCHADRHRTDPSIAHVDASPGGETTELRAGPAGGL